MSSTTNPAAAPQKPRYKAGILIFPGADILDYAGPIEILSHALWNRNPESPDLIFQIETFAASTSPATSTGKGALAIQPTQSISAAKADIHTYDVLIVPGAPPNIMKALTANGGTSAEVDLVRTFYETPYTDDASSKRNGLPKVLLSVCTGAFLLAAAGALENVKEATTHHRALATLQGMVKAEETKIVGGKRYVDAGVVRDGVRVVTSGGVSSGMEGALHLVELFAGEETAAFIGRVMEWERRDV